jgi:predicted nucleotide-binding protein (sugar kinase/HSP70/actin superfamily)
MVVRSRPIGSNVIFQGGVANNTAVHAAFEALLGREIMVHPYPAYSGALGAALTARDEMADKASRFSGFTHLDKHYALESFVCSDCENACEIKRVQSDTPFSFGSICGKHDTASSGKTPPQSPFSLRQKWLFDDYPVRKSRHIRGDIGLPMGLGMHEQLPFWKTFFAALGFNPVVSGSTTRAIAEQGAQKLPVETCMPIKVLFGHALHLAGKGCRLFVPHTMKLKPDGENDACFLCPYTQASGYIIRSKICPQTVVLEYPADTSEDGWVYSASRTLAIGKREVAGALKQARAAMHEFRRRCRECGQQVLNGLDDSQKPCIVLIGRPYVLGDRYITMDLPRQLERLGVTPIPMDFLDLDNTRVPPFFDDMHWYMGRQSLKAAEYVRGNNNLACITLTTFGCGPDAFIGQYIESILQHAPQLVLEFDEHRADTGMITRLEAFLRTLRHAGRFSRTDVYLNKGPIRKDRPLREYRYFIQHFSDHAYAFAGALRAVGCHAEVLPETDDTSVRLAKGYAHGNECHPYNSVLGDLLRLVKQPGFNPAGSAYFSPKYDGPCLLNQYGTAIRIILERIGAGDVALLNIGNMAVMDELFPVYPLYLARSSHAIDRLSKWAAEIRPYERKPGEVQAVHKRNMELLLERMQQRRLDTGIREAVASMQAIELSERRDLPVIGIIGDIYTRLNAHANFGLADKLNASGFEIWTSALIMDVVLLGYEQRSRDLHDHGKHLKGIIARGYLPAARILRASVDRYFPDIIRTPQESAFPELNRRIAPYIDHRVDKFISLNINRVGELQQAGADGVLNVMCPGCMVGTVSEAFFPELRRQYADLPLESLSFGDQQSTHVDNRLEAFCHLVRESRNRVR